MTADSVERTAVIPRPIERVWNAIATPEQLKRWSGTSMSGDIRPGGDVIFDWGAGSCRGRIVAIEPHTYYAYRWLMMSGDNPDLSFDEQVSTLVEFHLAPVDGGTQITVNESGFSKLTEAQAQVILSNQEGWTHMLRLISEYVTGDQG